MKICCGRYQTRAALTAAGLACLTLVLLAGCSGDHQTAEKDADKDSAAADKNQKDSGIKSGQLDSSSQKDKAAAAPDKGADSDSPTGSPGNVGLEIGNIAPEIDGEDIDGVAFKLSDYRGKIVVLDFWGNW